MSPCGSPIPWQESKMSLQVALLKKSNRDLVVADCEILVRSEVANKSGLGGIAVKGAFGLINRIRPTFVREAVNELLNDFIQELEPFYSQYQQSPQSSFGQYLNERSKTVASALLQAADHRVDQADQPGVQKAYKKLRPTGEKHVESAVPGIAAIVEKYLS